MGAIGSSLLEEDGLSPFYKDKREALLGDVVPRSRGIAVPDAEDIPKTPASLKAPQVTAPAAPAPVAQPKQELPTFNVDAFLSGSPAPDAQQPAKKEGNTFNVDAFLGVTSAPQQETQKPASESGDTGRGFSTALEQTPALAKGFVGVVGATGEKAFGEGGMWSSLKRYGLEGYQKDMAAINKTAKETDDVTVAWDRAKKGDIGALVDWAQYGIGYLGGNIVETVGTSLIGAGIGAVASGPAAPAGAAVGAVEGVVAKDAVKGVVKNLVESMVAKEAAKLAEKAGVETATDVMVQQATKTVAKGIGSASAMAGSSIIKETGGIYGEAVEQKGGDLDAGDLARVWGSGIVAGLSEAAVDKLGLDAAAGKFKIPGGGRVGRSIVGAAAGVGIEGGQELLQTAIERVGADKALTGEDAMRDYINSFALGGLGGGTVGGVVGALRSDKADGNKVKKILDEAQKEFDQDDTRQSLFESMRGDQQLAQILAENGIESADDPKFMDVIQRTLATNRLLADLNIPTDEERMANTEKRRADVEAAFAEQPAAAAQPAENLVEKKDLNSAGFVQEPQAQVQAQVDAVAEGRKAAAVVGAEEFTKINVPEGLFAVQVKDEQGATSYVISKDASVGVKAQQRVKEVGFKPAMGEVLGYVETTKTDTDANAKDVIVQQRDDKTGQVLDEQAVSPENVDAVAPIAGTTKSVTNIQNVVEDRKAQTQGEQNANQEQQPAKVAAAKPEAVDQAAEGKDQNAKGQAPVAAVESKQQADVTPNKQDKTSSWVIRNKETGEVVMETFDKAKVDALNTDKYEAVPALQHLQELNKKTKAENQTKAEKSAKQPAAPKVDRAALKAEAIDVWDGEEGGDVEHIKFADLPKQKQRDWLEAYAPTGGERPYAGTPLYEQIVKAVRKNERTERINKKAAENRASKEEADGILDLKRTAGPKRDFAYVQVKTLANLERAAQAQLDSEGNGETIELSAVPVGSLVNKLPGIGVIEQAAKLFGKKVKYFRVIGGTNFFDGAVIPGSDTIFINVNARFPHLSIFGHELVHSIKNAHPQTYERLKNFLMPMLDEAGMIEFALKQQRDGVTKSEAILEEAIGDIVGDRFAETAFWQMMADENPSLFKQIADIAVKFINDAIAKLTGRDANLGSNTLLKDLTTARDGIALILKDLGDMVQEAQQPVEQKQQTEGQAPVALKRREEKEVKGFYSALERAFANPKISLDKSGATTGQQWKAWLNSKKAEMGVREAEIEWVGINEWLDLNAKEKLTAEQVKTWVAGNRVNVNDILLRSYGRVDELPTAEFVEPDEDTMREFIRDKQEEYESDRDMGDFDEDVFDQSPDDMTDGEMRSWISENYGWQNFMYQYRRGIENFQRGRINKMTRPKHGGGNLVLGGGTNYAELVLFDPTIASYAQGDDVHYGDVARGQAIGWIRMNERKDSDGNDVLFLEELQSKRAQDARKDSSVPDAPFIKSTESWTSLLIKRAIAYAQQRGINRIAWTTGEQQNERYKFPGDELVYEKDEGADTYTLTVKKDGEEVRTVTNVSTSNLAAYVGTNTATEIESDSATSGVLKGDDLSVMEANLQPYYNQTVPSVVKDVLKKLKADTQVEVMQIEGTGQQLGFLIPESVQQTVAEDGLPMFKRSAYEAQFADLDQKTRDMAVAKGHVSPPTVRERIEALRPNMWKRVVQATFDRFRSVKDVSLKAYMMLRLSSGPQDGAVATLLQYGQVFNDDGALNVKKGTKGLLEILNPVGGEVDRFLLWIAANRAGELKKQDRERFFSDEEIARLKKLDQNKMADGRSRYAVYRETLRQMNELNRSVLDVARQTGLINEESYKKFAADIWYIPFYRQMEDDGSLSAANTSSAAVGQYLSKKLKGSERALNDLMENVLLNWSHILSASMKNQAAVETLKAAEQMKDVVSKITPIGKDNLGRDASGELVNLKYTVKVMEKGETAHYRIDDEFLLASLDAVTNIPSYGFWTNTAREFKTTLTRFISLSPTFKINNLIRDSIQSIGITELKKNPVANVIEGWRAYKGDHSEALAGGGLFAMGNAFDGDRATNVKRLAAKGANLDNVLNTQEKVTNFFKKYWDKYDEASDAMENANRLALYNQLREAGATHLEAAYAARDLQDFSLQGSSVAVRYLSQILPYFNARLQGLYKLGRDGIDPTIQALSGNATEGEMVKAKKFATVLGAITMFGVLLYLSQKDDDDYDKLEDWERDSFFWAKIPGTQTAIRIPKPFEMGAVATIAERFTEQLVNENVEGKVFGKRLLAVLADNLAINPIPQVVRPLYDIARNKDGFTDRAIESMGQERLSKDERRNPGTSGAAVTLSTVNSLFANFAEAATGGAANAQNLQLSPIQYDYLLRGYLGWVGTAIQTASNVAAAPFKPGESSRFERVDDFLVVGNYIKTLPQPSSKYVTGFYENAQVAAMAVADMQHYINLGQSEKAFEIFEKNKDRIGMNKVYTKAQDLMSDIGKQIKLIEENPEMPGDMKRSEIDRLGQLRVEYAKSVEQMRVRFKKQGQ